MGISLFFFFSLLRLFVSGFFFFQGVGDLEVGRWARAEWAVSDRNGLVNGLHLTFCGSSRPSDVLALWRMGLKIKEAERMGKDKTAVGSAVVHGG